MSRQARARLAPALLIALLCALALREGLRTTSALRWPHDQDLYRDVAQAQAFADGAWTADPYYRGELRWYNPLAPAMVAAASRLSGAPVGVVYTHAGAWLGLLAPLLLAALAWRVAGPWGAALATFHFLFVRAPFRPAWSEATYSPWLFSANLAQPLLYAGLLAVTAAACRPRARRWSLAGALLGLVFLAHTAPALVLGCVLVLAAVSTRSPSRRAPGALAALGVALVVATPLLWTIVGHYGLAVRNPAPAFWEWAPDAPSGLPRLVRAATWGGAAIGLAACLRVARRRVGARVVLLWTGVSAALLGARVLAARGWPLPAVVPAFHFAFSLAAAASVLFACGVRALAVLAARQARLPRRPAVAGAALAAMALLGAWALPAYPGRDDFALARLRARELAAHEGWERARSWLRASAGADDVVLCSDDVGLFVAGPAGRRVLAVEDVFSNPYVPWTPRAEARDAMWRALRAGDGALFRSLAAPWGVTLVLASRVERPWAERGLGAPDAEWAGLAVFRVR